MKRVMNNTTIITDRLRLLLSQEMNYLGEMILTAERADVGSNGRTTAHCVRNPGAAS